MRTHPGIRPPVQPRFGSAPVRLISIMMLSVGVLCDPWPAAAQPRPWDAVFVAGVLAGRPDLDDPRDYRDAWFDTAQAGVVVGRHLSPNLKVEIELTTAAEGRQYVQRYVTIAGVPYPVPYASERFTTLRQASGSVVWQFFNNEWVHPFVEAGVAANFERVRTHIRAQNYYVTDPRLPGSRVIVTEERFEGPDTTTTMGLVLGGGAKLYATPRVFVRTDGRFIGDGSRHSVALRLGLGVDF